MPRFIGFLVVGVICVRRGGIDLGNLRTRILVGWVRIIRLEERVSVVRYRATDRASAVAAILAVVEYAREHGGDCMFEPRTAGQMGKVGLLLDGPPKEVEAVRAVLDKVEGVVEVDR